MDPHALRDEAMELLRKLGVEVRLENLGGEGGGSCTIKGRRVVLVDLDAGVQRQLDSCLEGLKGAPGIESVYVTPALRSKLEPSDEDSPEHARE